MGISISEIHIIIAIIVGIITIGGIAFKFHERLTRIETEITMTPSIRDRVIQIETKLERLEGLYKELKKDYRSLKECIEGKDRSLNVFIIKGKNME